MVIQRFRAKDEFIYVKKNIQYIREYVDQFQFFLSFSFDFFFGAFFLVDKRIVYTESS